MLYTLNHSCKTLEDRRPWILLPLRTGKTVLTFMVSLIIYIGV